MMVKTRLALLVAKVTSTAADHSTSPPTKIRTQLGPPSVTLAVVALVGAPAVVSATTDVMSRSSMGRSFTCLPVDPERAPRPGPTGWRTSMLDRVLRQRPYVVVASAHLGYRPAGVGDTGSLVRADGCWHRCHRV